MKDYPEDRRAAQSKTMTGRVHSVETKQKISVANTRVRCYKTVITPTGEFESVSAAALAHNMTPSGAIFRLKKGLDGWKRGDRDGLRDNLLVVTDPNGKKWLTIPAAAKGWNMTTKEMTALLRTATKDPNSGWSSKRVGAK
jgi:hypothetical protein